MDFTTIFIIAGVVIVAIFFLIARLAVRWILRVTIVAVILIAILGAGIFWWWSTSLTTKPQSKPRAVTRNSSN
jgi:energy-coupling factor transporter transmembrane protein EcfT